MPTHSISERRCFASSGSSIGWVVNQEMLLHIFRRLALEVRHLAAEALEVLVHPPHRRGDPAEAALDEDDLQLREAFRDAFEHEAGERAPPIVCAFDWCSSA